ncbi:MAG: LicD family protein [Lachnospiraceae bacterium]|nr:LicD family protein [Lachnospiraceae bacterium]
MGMDITGEELRKMQLLQLEILLELDRICRKHNIRYNLSGGSLLGAVRHKGFIPWDDDIDVRMLREEYEKFCEVCKTELDTDRYYLQTNVTEEEYRWGFSRILINGTKYVREGQEHLKCRTGVFIDLFPSDGCPDAWFMRKYQGLIALFMRKALWSPVGSEIIKNPFKRCFFGMLNKIPKSKLLKVQDYLISLGKRKKFDRVVCWGLPRSDVRRWGFSKKVLKRKKGAPNGIQRVWLEEVIEVPFEGHMVFIPKDFDGWLTHVYGSTYMQLPPENKRKIHHDVSEYQLCEPRV